jgi:hypothetical protein
MKSQNGFSPLDKGIRKSKKIVRPIKKRPQRLIR